MGTKNKEIRITQRAKEAAKMGLKVFYADADEHEMSLDKLIARGN